MHLETRSAKSSAFEILFLLGSPWGLAKIDDFRPISLAILFIYETNIFNGS
jgi:hypothetical protein